MGYFDKAQIKEEEQIELWEIESLGIKKKSFIAGYDEHDKPKFRKYRVDQWGCRMYDELGFYIPKSERKKEWEKKWNKNKKNIQWQIQLEKENQNNEESR